MARSFGFVGKLLQQAELVDISKHIPLTEVAGCERVLIENHQCIMQYTPQCICVKVKFGCIRIQGSGLTLSQMTASQVVVNGSIESLSFLKKDSCGRR